MSSRTLWGAKARDVFLEMQGLIESFKDTSFLDKHYGTEAKLFDKDKMLKSSKDLWEIRVWRTIPGEFRFSTNIVYWSKDYKLRFDWDEDINTRTNKLYDYCCHVDLYDLHKPKHRWFASQKLQYTKTSVQDDEFIRSCSEVINKLDSNKIIMCLNDLDKYLSNYELKLVV